MDKWTYPVGQAQEQQNGIALAVMCALDHRPFNVVECEGFRYFVQTITQGRYVLPARKTVRATVFSLAEQLRTKTQKQLEADIAAGSTVNLTFDAWTDS